MAWLSCLVWPDEAGRAERLQAAVKAARDVRPSSPRRPAGRHRPVAARSPHGATLVVYHSGVLAYVDEAKRRAFGTTGGGPGRRSGFSNEAVGVSPT